MLYLGRAHARSKEAKVYQDRCERCPHAPRNCLEKRIQLQWKSATSIPTTIGTTCMHARFKEHVYIPRDAACGVVDANIMRPL